MEFTWRDEAPVAKSFGERSVVVSAFPSAGLATTVAAHYMIRALNLPRIGRFESPEIAPIAVVQSGEVHPTIRVYGRSDLGLVLSEFPPSPSQANSIARTILDAAERHKARMIVGLEGVVPHPPGGDEETEDEESAVAEEQSPEQVWVAYSHKDAAVLKAFEPSKARLLEDGVIGGVSGALLVQGMGRPLPVVVMLVSARVAEGLPDHRAGAALIETLDRVLPELEIDTGPLRAQAEQIEKALRAVMKSHPPVAAPPEGHATVPTPGMYG
ncbi:MAG TPA: PAC2 family protein [Thermoplasmata archaeon]|jgi:predicted ATP-grasp superfamily ATP-dependent carboligase|nr:PAC2 family protein [Thermoplasmata archaeon]